MRYTFRLFGVEIASLEVEEDAYEVDEVHTIGGGASHNFSFSGEFVDERFLPWDDEAAVKRFGFW